MHPLFVSIPIPEFLLAILTLLGVSASPTFDLHTYGLLTAFGFLMAILLITYEGKRRGLEADLITNLLFGLILSGLISARVLFILVEWRYYLERPWSMINLREGGLIFQGGLIGALVYAWYFMKKHGIPFWQTADVIIIGLPLGHVFGRMGCLAAGCCFGKPADLPWAITFTDPLSAGPPLGVPIHPVQVYESMGNLLIFLFLWHLLRRVQFNGQVTLMYLMLYPAFRVLVELFRGDDIRGFFLQDQLGQRVSTSQAISLVELIIAWTLYRKFRPKKHIPPQDQTDSSMTQEESA